MKTRRGPGWSRRARCRAGLALVLALALALAAAAEAGEPAGLAPPVFHVETITVETQRLSPEIVRSESLLREGSEYSEAELREAVHRINRLPFVLLAEFSLRKGSERDLYELVIRVYEARRWFFQLGLTHDDEDPFDRFERIGEINERFTFDDDGLDALIGRRFAVGRKGLLFASIGAEDGPFALGYQHYNLWDRNILFSLTVASDEGSGGGVREGEAVTAQLGIPIRGNHALRLLAGRNKDSYRFFAGQGITQRRDEVEVAWVFNSLDDPVLPREGSLFEAGVTWADTEDRRVFLDLLDEFQVQRFTGRSEAVAAVAARHWPLTARQSASAGIGGSFGNRPDDSTLLEAEASLGHQLFLLRKLEPGKWRELRFETQLSGLRQEFRDGNPDFGFPLTTNSWRLRAGLVYRNGWGLFSLVYDWTDREFE